MITKRILLTLLVLLAMKLYSQKYERFEALTYIQYNENSKDTLKLNQLFILDISYSDDSKIFMIEEGGLTIIRDIKYDRSEKDFLEEIDTQRYIQFDLSVHKNSLTIVPPLSKDDFWLITFSNEEFFNNCDCNEQFYARTYLSKRRSNY